MISEERELPAFLKGYKTCYEFLKPLLGCVAVIAGILCCFDSAEGSHARLASALWLLGALALILILTLINLCLEKRGAYRTWQSGAVSRLAPGTMLPLLLMVIVIVVPFYILLVTSIKNPVEANDLVFTWWPRQGIDLSSYRELFSYGATIGVTMGRAVVNSFVYAIVPTVVGLLAASLSAYAFSKLHFRGRNLMYQLLIMTMMMPGCVTMTTAYIMYDWYGWTNSALPLVAPGCFSGAATVMFLREYFMGIPDGILEAARIDGAGKWKAFAAIMLPLGRPALLAQFILNFITKYNDFVNPLIYLNDPDKYTIQVALNFLNGAVQDRALIASAGVFSLIPMLLLYVIFQKQIIHGISMSSGLKG